jgi:type II secretory pathway pseudopilin PulG
MIRANQRRLQPRRRGMTLIEIMVLMTAVAVMLGMTVIVLQLAMKLDADGRGRLERSTALGRLSRRFRADVHTATAIEAVGSGLKLEPNPGRSITYEVPGDGEIARVDAVDGKVAARETYIMPQSGEVRLSLRDVDGRRFAVLAVDTIVRKNRIDPVRTLEILALAAKDRHSPTADAKPEGGRP